MSRFATQEGTQRYAARFRGRAAEGHFREQAAADGLVLSSIGIGTYLGNPDEATDRGYTQAVVSAVRGGINVVDSAINYRMQRSERSIGAALRQLFAEGYSREEVVLCTKGGYLTTDGEMPADPREYFRREYFDRGVCRRDELAGGIHSMTPGYLADQLARSRRNLGVECVDIYYLHNAAESQLPEVGPDEFRRRLRTAFEFLESAAAEGHIRFYGMATWDCFRRDPRAADHMTLAEVVALAREAGGPGHRFRFVQLPFNLGMPEALTLPNQTAYVNPQPLVKAAADLGLALVASASLLQGRLRNLPKYVGEALGQPTDYLNALQFARSSPGITTALVGIRRPEHVAENLRLVSVPPATQEQFLRLFEPARN